MSEDFDVVILDVLMPGKEGIATLKEIKKQKSLSYIIMPAGNTTAETAIKGMKQCAYGSLHKYFPIESQR